ncbi:hypothetical protein LCGC14_2125200, partial [marine sediment metagenome]
SDLRKRITGKDGDDRYKDGYTKGLKEGKTAQAAQTKAQQGKEGGPNLAPSKPGGGGKSPEQTWLDEGSPMSGPVYDSYQAWRKEQGL